MSVDQFKELSSRLLRAQLEYVSKTPFYQTSFRANNVDLGHVKSVEDITKLPFVEKEELRRSQEESPPFGLHMACKRGDIKRVYLTSGSTGQPTFVGLTSNDLGDWIESA